MFGLVTRNTEELTWDDFDIAFYEVKEVSGRQTDPVPNGVNTISCHGDTIASEDEALVPVDDRGRPATRDHPQFEWGYVCPTHERYRSGLLEIIAQCGAVNPNVRLDDVGFPRHEFCHCERCEARFAASDHQEWSAWRSSVITSFLQEARERVPGRLYLTLYPDPYPGHLSDRSGIDVSAIEEMVDELIIPLYDMSYTTTYWVEILTEAFADMLDTPLSVELYAHQVNPTRLIEATEAIDPHTEHVIFGYEAGTARTVIRRLRADEGVTYGEPG